jgi:hypothetical protein
MRWQKTFKVCFFVLEILQESEGEVQLLRDILEVSAI